MTPESNVEVSILTCPYETGFLGLTVPHLIKSLGNVAALRTLLVDWMPISGYYSAVYPERQETRFEEICSELLAAGWIDRIVRIPYDRDYVSQFLKRTVRGKFRATHDIRGAPIYGYMYGLLASEKRYVVHFDSDMLIHQGTTENWIRLGMDLLARHSDVGAVMPRSGPPTPDALIHQANEQYSRDPRGFHSFTSFSSRVFLANVEKFRAIHPVKPLWLGSRDRLRALWDGKGKALSWESIITHAFQNRGLRRADLISSDSWSLHPPTKDETFRTHLPALIAAIEAGRFPATQAGHYDLALDHWMPLLREVGTPRDRSDSPADCFET